MNTYGTASLSDSQIFTFQRYQKLYNNKNTRESYDTIFEPDKVWLMNVYIMINFLLFTIVNSWLFSCLKVNNCLTPWNYVVICYCRSLICYFWIDLIHKGDNAQRRVGGKLNKIKILENICQHLPSLLEHITPLLFIFSRVRCFHGLFGIQQTSMYNHIHSIWLEF